MRFEENLEDIIHNYDGSGKTLLMVDCSGNESSFKFFQHSLRFTIMDAKMMATKRMVNNHTISSILDDARHVLAYAMKYGKILVIRMGDCSVDFRTTLCDEACVFHDKIGPRSCAEEYHSLPRGFMLNNGELLKSKPYPDAIMRKEDWREINCGDCTPLHPNFKIIISTCIPLRAEWVDLFILIEQLPTHTQNPRHCQNLAGSILGLYFFRVHNICSRGSFFGSNFTLSHCHNKGQVRFTYSS